MMCCGCLQIQKGSWCDVAVDKVSCEVTEMFMMCCGCLQS